MSSLPSGVASGMKPSGLTLAGQKQAASKTYLVPTRYRLSTKSGPPGAKLRVGFALDRKAAAAGVTMCLCATIYMTLLDSSHELVVDALNFVCGDSTFSELESWLRMLKCIVMALVAVFVPARIASTALRDSLVAALPAGWIAPQATRQGLNPKTLLSAIAASSEPDKATWMEACSAQKMKGLVKDFLKLTDPGVQSELRRLQRTSYVRTAALLQAEAAEAAEHHASIRHCLCCGLLTTRDRQKLHSIVVVFGKPYLDGQPYRSPLNVVKPDGADGARSIYNKVCANCLPSCQRFQQAYDTPSGLEAISARSLRLKRRLNLVQTLPSDLDSGPIECIDDVSIEELADTIANAIWYTATLERGELWEMLQHQPHLGGEGEDGEGEDSTVVRNSDALAFVAGKLLANVTRRHVVLASQTKSEDFDFAEFDVPTDGASVIPRSLHILVEKMTPNSTYAALVTARKRHVLRQQRQEGRTSDDSSDEEEEEEEDDERYVCCVRVVVLPSSRPTANTTSSHRSATVAANLEDLKRTGVQRLFSLSAISAIIGGLSASKRHNALRSYWMMTLNAMGVSSKGDLQFTNILRLTHSYDLLLRAQHRRANINKMITHLDRSLLLYLLRCVAASPRN